MSNFEVYELNEQSVSLNYSGGEIKVKESNHERGFGIRAIKNGKIGFSYTQEELKIKDCVKKAENSSKYGVNSSFKFAQNNSTICRDIVDSKIENSDDLEDLEGILKQIVDNIERSGANARVVASEGIEKMKIENSNGLNKSYAKTYHSIYTEAMDGSGMGFSYNGSIKRDTDPDRISALAIDMAKQMKKAKKVESGDYRVVISPQAIETLLEVLLPSFSGEWLRKGITKVKLGNKFSDRISIYDNPKCGLIGDRPIDDEGVSTEKIPLIEKGIVKSFLFDRETASLANMKMDGSCSRAGYDTSPTIGHTNLEVGKGEVNTIDEFGDYVEIISMHGSHTSNATSGDFGMEVNIARHVTKGGRETIPIRGFVMSGNIFNLLNQIEAIEKEQVRYANVLAPRIAFDKIRLIS